MNGQKEIIKTILKFLKSIILVLVAGIAFYLGTALLFSFLPTHPPKHNCLHQYEVFVASNGIHLDIFLPIENIEPQILHQLDVLPGTLFIGFGWGDKDFYIKTPEWTDLTFPVAFKALFLKSEAAMHVTYLPFSLQSWQKIQLCNSQLKTLNLYIENSFKKDKNGNFLKTNFNGYSHYDTFYDATGSFSLFKTCNVWVNTALKKIEIKTSVWSPFNFGVLFHIPNGRN